MENSIILEIRRELSGFKNDIQNDLRTVNKSIRINESIRSLRSDVGGLRSDVDTNTKDLHNFRKSIDKELKASSQRDANLRDALDHGFKSVDDRFRDMHQRFEEMKADNARLLASVRNGKLSNPFLPIHPLPIYLPNQGITYPEAIHFPKNANEFYALRQPSSRRQTAMLAYLAMFYDISHYKKHGDTAIQDPESAVEYLESFLGLDEDNFTRFKERAREFDGRPKAAPIKRADVSDVEHLFPHKRQRLRHSSSPESRFTYGPEDKLGWRFKSFSNPPETQLPMARGGGWLRSIETGSALTKQLKKRLKMRRVRQISRLETKVLKSR
ncbi:wac protein [Fusarium austroafricanum]|uniref:Wac protein n=1 Tax=Fusarium austroafricanum TaxID=2364996 RepID=A0A8H4KQ03_9HYPO|nr:wac protein [Fusarium austroafricanum]